LFKIMKKYGCTNIVFSSSATVYGNSEILPFTEELPTNPVNPYGKTKSFCEEILHDLYNSDPEWNICILRYFNPVGAHESALIGESPLGIPNNLMPNVVLAAMNRIDTLKVFGNDYPTPDGTCVRDYIHVVDLAKGHLLAFNKLICEKGYYVYNLGTGTGYSVLELLNTFEKVNNLKLNYVFADRRPGDLPIMYADPSKAKRELGWSAKLGLEDMCRSAWNFAKKYI